MKKIWIELLQYIRETNKPLFAISTAFIAVFIFCNFNFGIADDLEDASPVMEYLGWFGVFLSAFSFPYLIGQIFYRKAFFKETKFIILLIIAPLLFAWKMAASVEIFITLNKNLNNYWNKVLYWPVKLIVITSALYIIWRLFDKKQPFYGLNSKGFDARPYLWMLVIMIPLIAAAATQPDFLEIYPKLKNVNFLSGENNGWYKLLYELSYGTDFFGIELFFRGFLILAFVKWAGKDAILPMALFYCTIHFGKPLGECISSFFGGILLGVVTYHTRSIWGGLMVHLGIAWLMELAGYISTTYF